MRQAGTIPDEQDAARFVDYLSTLGITTRVEAKPDGCDIWVREEEHVRRAVQELDEFTRNPTDPRYLDAQQKARALGREAGRKEAEYRKNFVEVRRRWPSGARGARPLTMALVVLSVAVAVASNIGGKLEPLLARLTITSITDEGEMVRWSPGLPEIHRGQIWRLLTPIFIHFGIPHLLLNLFALSALGTLVEVRRGTWRLALLVLVAAAASNLGQYWASGNPLFGGMSGVLYALFGYAWMKSRYEPAAGIYLHPQTVWMMIGWFFLCMTGWVGPIANAAHGVGLGVGVLAGYAPIAWRKLQRR